MPMDLLAQLLSGLDTFKRRAGQFAADPMAGIAERSGPAFGEGQAPERSARQRIEELLNADKISETPAGQAALNMLGAIKVFHGSPHTFDKFDLSKIGTGEGAQAYGHGLYFAENPGVAKGYADVGAMVRDKRDATNDVIHQMAANSPDSQTPDMVRWYMKQNPAIRDDANDDEVVQTMLRAIKGRAPNGTVSNATLKEYNALEKLIPETKPQMYEANLRWPDPVREATDPLGPQHFLDWDKPLSQQPQAQAALEKAGVFSGTKKFDDWDALIGPGGTYVNPKDAAQRAYIAAQQAHGADAASAMFKQAGIPGIRYLDAGSRAGPQNPIAGGYYANKNQTANYVLFDDALAEILKRNGQPVKKPPPQPNFQQLKDYERRVQTGVEGLEGEAKYKALREIAAMLQGQL